MIILLKGAPEHVIAMCSTVMFEGKDIELSDELKKSYIDASMQLASDGERIVGEYLLDTVRSYLASSF